MSINVLITLGSIFILCIFQIAFYLQAFRPFQREYEVGTFPLELEVTEKGTGRERDRSFGHKCCLELKNKRILLMQI